MNEPELLDDLLDTWVESRSTGKALSTDELCRDYPHLKAKLEYKLRAVRAIDALRLPRDAGSANDTTDAAATSLSASASATTSIEGGPGPAPGELNRLGDYRIMRRLGEGGMGCVFVAEHVRLKRLDALKLMNPAAAALATARERFLREAQTAASIKHDNIVTIYHVGEESGTPFIAMELLEGESLEKRLRREPPVTIAEFARIGREAAEGLSAAHARGLIHRDVKPSNLFLEGRVEKSEDKPGGFRRVKLLDFGLAKLADADSSVTQAGSIVGSPAFMSPEQAAGQELDVRSDLFSLGVVLYLMATGRLPFNGDNTLQLLRQIDTYAPTPPDQLRRGFPSALSELVMKLLAKAPADRLASADDVVAILRYFERGAAINFSDAITTTIDLPRSHRQRPLLGILGLVGMLTVAAFVATTLISRKTNDPSPATPTNLSTTRVARALAPLKGSIDIQVRESLDGPARRINRPENLPVKPGEWMRIEIDLNREAYVYVVWLDTEGRATPLYPWIDGDWTKLPEEKPCTTLALPAGEGKLAPIGGGPPGVESLLLLVRETPLPEDSDLNAVFGSLPAQKRADVAASAWFENGELVSNEVDRGAVNLGQAASSNDPILMTQSLLRTRLKDLFPYTRAVCFGNKGDR